VLQSTTVDGSAVPEASENTRPSKHAPAFDTSNSKSVPSPAAIVPPVRLNPITVEALLDIVKPAAVASPPPALTISAPSILNWKPAIAVSVS